MYVDDLAKFMFKDNINNTIIELSLGGVENNKDLFCFFVDLLCKGLVILYGKDSRVEIDELNMNDFTIVKNKMRLAGIDVLLDAQPNIDRKASGINILDIIETTNDNANLEDFSFKVTCTQMIYRIKFALIHAI